MRFTPSQTGSRLTWSSLTRISAALGPSVPSCLGHWNVRYFGLLQSRSPTGTCQHVVELMNGYKRLFLDAQPTDGDDAKYKVIVVVFTDLSADRAQVVFDEVLQHLAVPSYAEDGILFGPFYEGNEGTAIYNSSFRPFQIARAISVREAWGHQRLEVLPGQRGLAQLVGASLWRIRSPRSC